MERESDVVGVWSYSKHEGRAVVMHHARDTQGKPERAPW